MPSLHKKRTPPQRRVAQVDLKGLVIACKVVTTPEEHRVGLMKTAKLGPNEGMLFLFDDVRTRTFHMANVKYPIDIIGLDADSKVTRIAPECQPGSYDTWSFPRAAAVLEVAGGTCREVGLKVGDVLTAAKTEGTEKTAQIVDEQKFVDKVSKILMSHADELEWTPDVLNAGATERAVVNRTLLARWLQGDAEDAATKHILAAASSEQGLDLVGDAFILAGMADIARVGFSAKQPILVLYRMPIG